MPTLRIAIALIAMVTTVAAGASSAKAARGDSLSDAAGHLEAVLRTAIEGQPEGLLKSLSTAERVCELAERAEGRNEMESAEADWSTLNQVVEQLGKPELASVRRALREARSELSEVESEFRRTLQGQGPRLRMLRRGAGEVRRGIDQVAAGLDVLPTAFTAWEEHRCEAALASTATSTQKAGAGVGRITSGMEGLWILAVLEQQGTAPHA